jgi:hypothetical protein
MRQAIDLKGVFLVFFMLRTIELLLALTGLRSILEIVDPNQHPRSQLRALQMPGTSTPAPQNGVVLSLFTGLKFTHY